MRKLLLSAAIGLVCAIGVSTALRWVDPAISMPFATAPQPSQKFLAAQVVYPQRTGGTGYTVQELLNRFTNTGNSYAWELGDNGKSWILRYYMTIDISRQTVEGAIRFVEMGNPFQAAITKGDAVVVTQMAESGRVFNDVEILIILDQFGGGIREDRRNR